ncbi:MAG: hypothetical protein ACRESZ_17960, partial [Methylococcales bacterium]
MDVPYNTHNINGLESCISLVPTYGVYDFNDPLRSKLTNLIQFFGGCGDGYDIRLDHHRHLC